MLTSPHKTDNIRGSVQKNLIPFNKHEKHSQNNRAVKHQQRKHTHHRDVKESQIHRHKNTPNTRDVKTDTDHHT